MQGQTAENFQESIKNVISLLEGLKFQFQLIEDEELEWLIIGTLQTEIGALRLSVYMQKKASHFVLYLYHPLTILEPLRNTAAEFIARANYGLPIGNFEMDFADGELRFKVGIPVLDIPVSRGQFAQALEILINTTIYYHTPLVRTLYDGVPSQRAIEDTENASKK